MPIPECGQLTGAVCGGRCGQMRLKRAAGVSHGGLVSQIQEFRSNPESKWKALRGFKVEE